MVATDDVSRKREILERCPPGHAGRDVALFNLANALWRRFRKERKIDDLFEAIPLHRDALQLRPVENEKGHRSDSLNNLAFCLYRRYGNLAVVDDLEEAITIGREALALRPPGHPHRGASLNNLGVYLRTRFEKQAEVCDLEEAIQLCRAVLELHPPSHRWRSLSLRHLILCLSSRYERQGLVKDLEELVTLRRAELEFYPRGHSDHVASLHNLAYDLRRRYAKTAGISDLEESTCELAFCQSRRHDRRGVAEDLEEAVTLGREALKHCPQGHPNRASFLHNLAQCLSYRFREKPAAADLDDAIALEQEALRLLVHGEPEYAVSRRCLTACLKMKFKSQVVMMSSDASGVTHLDIEQAIRNAAFEILKTMPTRLFYTPTGILCNRDEQLSHFMKSERYKRLVSQCKTYDRHQQMDRIHADISRHFQYVTLSHRWGEGEPSLRDIEGHTIYSMSIKGGVGKLQAFCRIGLEWDYLWAWSDTCCIDKHSSAEVQETIGSMFAWYRQSALTIVHLSDVADTASLGSSEWFERGWTLQELLAPRSLLFYTENWSLYNNSPSSNHKTDDTVLAELERKTGIDRRFLTSFSPGPDDARLRLQWASLRRTTRPEDIAYSLFGIFNIHLPVMYGESAENALGRLLAEIVSQSGDILVLDWVGEPSPFHSCFPSHITSYQMLRLPTSQPNAEEQCSAINQQPTSFKVLQKLRGSLATSHPLHFPGQSLSPSSIARRVLPVHPRTPASYASSEVYDFHSLARVPPPRFFNRLLTLPCIAYHVTSVQLKEADLSTPSYMYNIVASGLMPLEIALPTKLEDVTRPQAVLHLVRPWHSKLLGPSADLDAVTDQQLLSALGRQFNALLLTQLPHNEHKRIASSILITARPMNQASILNSKIRIFNVV